MQTDTSSPHLTITAGVAEGSRVARVSLTQDFAFTRCVPSPPLCAISPARAVAPTKKEVPLAPPSLSVHPRTARCRAGRSGTPRRISPPHSSPRSSLRRRSVSSDAADDGFEAFEVERVGYDADDVDFRAPSKPKCVALGISGGLLAALVVACIVGTVATTWCVTSGPCGPAGATTTRSEAAAPSNVIASDMVAEFQADSAASSSRRRLVTSSEVTLASGTTVDAQDIAAAGAALSAAKTTYAAAIPAFVEGVVARLKTGESYMLLSAQDRAEIFKVTARTMVREAVTKELAPARAYFAELEATHTTAAGVVWGSEEKKILAPLIKSANVPHYRVDFAALVASKRRRLVATAPTTDEIKAMLIATNAARVRCATYAGAPLLALTDCECRWPWQAQQIQLTPPL